MYVLSGIVALIILVYIIGIMLPTERVVTRQSVFNISPQELYSIVTNNDEWQYRRGLKALNMLERNGDHEVWEEIANNGNAIRFETKNKTPFSFYSFDMSSQLFEGYWTAKFESIDNHRTRFVATEYIRIKNPFVKSLSYLFFDIGKLMEQYQEDLEKRVKEQELIQ